MPSQPLAETSAGERPARIAERYRLTAVLGSGGNATVYRATDELLSREVAIKVLRGGVSPAEDARQQTELTLLSTLNHHSLVSLFDAGSGFDPTIGSFRYLVMELVLGSNLHDRLAAGPMLPRHIAEIGYDIAEGIQYIHAHGVVHGDVKPSNILVVDYHDHASRARAKLTDFGIALATNTARMTGDNRTTGTAAYLSPEQAEGAAVGVHSDVYSLGLVLLECLTRKVAFPGTPVESALARLHRDPEIPDSVTQHWRSLLGAMTARLPANRPAPHELVPALRQLIISETSRHMTDDDRSWSARENDRLAAVRRYNILDRAPEKRFDRITALAARVLSTPIAIISVVDENRIWFRSRHGIEATEIARDPGLCASAIEQNAAWIIEDARVDPRALANPLVAGEFGLQFYAGVPLRTSDGFAVGTLCVIGFEPRVLSPDEIATLEDLAAIAARELERPAAP